MAVWESPTELAMAAKQLRNAWHEWVQISWEVQRATHAFNAMIMDSHRRFVVPPGYAIDYLGDGTVKPEAQCSKVPMEPPVVPVPPAE